MLTRKRGGGFEGSARERGGVVTEVAAARSGRRGGRGGGSGAVNTVSTESLQCEALDRARRLTLRHHQDGAKSAKREGGKLKSH